MSLSRTRINSMRKQGVSVSGLPDLETFKKWEQNGVDRWISVCGVGLQEIGGDVDQFTIPGHVYSMADPFSSYDVWTGGELPSKQIFLAASTPALRNTFLRAVRQAAASLSRGERLMVYCHLGKSRSPLVAAGALVSAFRVAPLDAWEQIAAAHEVGPLSELTLSALVWVLAET